MTDKPRTWPAALCVDLHDERLFNIRQLDGMPVFRPGVERRIAQQAWEAINQHFDWGKE